MNTFQNTAVRMIVLATLSGVFVFHVGFDVVHNVYAASLQSELRLYHACVKEATNQNTKVACNYRHSVAYDHLMTMCYTGGGATSSSNQKQSVKDACQQKYEYIDKKNELSKEQNEILEKLKKGRYDNILEQFIARQNSISGRNNSLEKIPFMFINSSSNTQLIPVHEHWHNKLTCLLCHFYDSPLNPFVFNRFEARTKIPKNLKEIKDPTKRIKAIQAFISLEIDKFHRRELMNANGIITGKMLGITVRKDRGETYTVQSNYNVRRWTIDDWKIIAIRSTSLFSCALGFLDKFIKVKAQKQLNDVLGLFGKIFGCASFGASITLPISGLWVVRKVTFY